MNWISVEDRLPLFDCVVDVWVPEFNDNYKRYTDVYFSVYNSQFYIDYDMTDITNDVSHWMPLPKPPEDV